jgi:hypothetical protein
MGKNTKKNQRKQNLEQSEPKIEKKQKFEKSVAKVFTFDINSNEITNESVELDSKSLLFNLNSPDLFNPD